MGIDIATIRTKVFTRMAADLTSPSYSKIANPSITTWANELAPLVTEHLRKTGADPGEYQKLKKIGETISLSASGIGTLPSDYNTHLGVKVLVGSNRKSVYRLYEDPDKFAKWDSSNFILTPTSRKPVALIAYGQIRVKPTSLSFAYLDYLYKHPAIETYNTYYGELGDTILVGLIAARCFDFLELHDLATICRNEVLK